jgi:hypothetical protein
MQNLERKIAELANKIAIRYPAIFFDFYDRFISVSPDKILIHT